MKFMNWVGVMWDGSYCNKDRAKVFVEWECSNCRKIIFVTMKPDYNFCPYCGLPTEDYAKSLESESDNT